MVKAGPLAGTMVDLALSHVLLGGVEEVGFHAEIIGVENVPPPTLEGVVDEDGTVVVDRDDSDLKGIGLGILGPFQTHRSGSVRSVPEVRAVHGKPGRRAGQYNDSTPARNPSGARYQDPHRIRLGMGRRIL